MFRLVILFIALVAGGGAAWIAFAMRGGDTAVVTILPEKTPVVSRDVLVASGDLVPGHIVTKDSMRWQAWPESAMHPTYISRVARPDALERLVGSIVRGSVIAGEPVREERLAPPNAGLLSSILRPGRRAVAVRITAENTAGGFILPNDRVDVLHTVGSRDKPEGQKGYSTRTILTNIAVLAIDQTLDDRQKDDKKAKPVAIGKTATLELDPRQAEMLAAAEAAGSLSLALRSAADNAEITIASPPTDIQPTTQTVFIVRGGTANAASKTQ